MGEELLTYVWVIKPEVPEIVTAYVTWELGAEDSCIFQELHKTCELCFHPKSG